MKTQKKPSFIPKKSNEKSLDDILDLKTNQGIETYFKILVEIENSL